MRRQPSPRGTAFTVLLVVAVLRDNELRLQRHDPIVARCDNRGGQHGVEILGLVLAAFAMETVRTMDLGRAVKFRSVQRDQHMSIQTSHGVKATALVQFSHEIGEHGGEPLRFDRIKLRAYLTVSGDFAHPEQGLTVRTALAGLQMALVRQKRRALHEERRERGQREIRHGVSCVLAPPPVGQGPAATTQGIEKAVLKRHRPVESYFDQRGKPRNHHDR